VQTTPGLDQYAIKNFARAFEIIPRTLASNAGFDVCRLLGLPRSLLAFLLPPGSG
jgi:T-complex protein 1 subunit theta